MGIESFLTSSAVECVVAQRLARKLCAHCKRRDRHSAGGRSTRPASGSATDLEAYEPVGCQRCHGSGYRGRMGIYSVMVLSERIKEMVVEHASEAEIAQLLRCEEGMLTLRQDGSGEGPAGRDQHAGDLASPLTA